VTSGQLHTLNIPGSLLFAGDGRQEQKFNACLAEVFRKHFEGGFLPD
jgi:hypothetical protein